MTTGENTTEARRPPSMAVAQLRRSFESGCTRPLAFRQRQLEGLDCFLKEREQEIEEALFLDMGKPRFEAFTAEVSLVAGEIALARKKLPSWDRPKAVCTSIAAQPGKSRVYHEPLGVVLIVGPWNYPVQLLLMPLIGAIAAGNCAVLKPSEIAPATSKLIAERLPEYVSAECVQVVEGGIPETTALLAERFDHIFYTGSGNIGRIVLEAAAKHLTPVTLELGGKSPCIVDRHTDVAVAARRILWGKFYNAGQSCVAPDYVLVDEAIEDKLLAAMKQTLHDFFGEDPSRSSDYGRIVNIRHHQRLIQLLDGSGAVFAGGESDREKLYIAPTILTDVPADAPIMVEEIFGPILPVLRVRDMDAAIAFVNGRPKPLALYLFSEDKGVQQRIIEKTSSGGISVNHTIMHYFVPSLPFGGVGASGMGAYHGKASFETFSHRKSVLVKPTTFDPQILYPPYDEKKRRWMQRLLG